MRERKAVRIEEGSGTSQVNGDAVGVGAVMGWWASLGIVEVEGGGTALCPAIEEKAGGGDFD
jgi:hypothetical protein